MTEDKAIIHPTAIIDSCVVIGKRCRIDAGAIIGFQGMLATKDDKGQIVRQNSKGGVIIEDDAWIGAGTVVQRGHHGDTIIGENSHIDVDCHIAHDCKIGKNVMIIASSTLAGVVKVGDNSHLSLGCVIRDGVTIGKNVDIGMGAVVTKDIPDGWIVVGNPAMRLEKFREQRKKLQSISPFPLRARLWNRLKPPLRKIRNFFQKNNKE
jgi:UDP-3-O-[3-hydroxymyristoyl] glucosamine N-acyltransferase